MTDGIHTQTSTTPSNSQPFSRESRSEHIATIIRDGICAGTWTAGQAINDQALATELGVSRTSVREALSRLVESRVVERIQWKGYYVRRLSWEEVENLVDIRLSLEKLAFTKAFDRIEEAIISELRKSIDQTEATISENDLAGFMRYDPLFHETIYRVSGNEWISYILNNSLTLLNVLRYMDKGDDFTDAALSSVRDHRSILDAIERRDIGLMLSRLEHHLLNHKERLRQQQFSDQASR